MFDAGYGIVPGTPFNHVTFSIIPGAISIGQVGITNNIVLTGWKSSITNGDYMVIELERRGSELGDVGAPAYLRDLTISYKTK